MANTMRIYIKSAKRNKTPKHTRHVQQAPKGKVKKEGTLKTILPQ